MTWTCETVHSLALDEEQLRLYRLRDDGKFDVVQVRICDDVKPLLEGSTFFSVRSSAIDEILQAVVDIAWKRGIRPQAEEDKPDPGIHLLDVPEVIFP